MILTDLSYVFIWWLVFFAIGIIFLPFCIQIFNKFQDLGYLFSKVLGAAIVSYSIFVLGILKLVPFNTFAVFSMLGVATIVNFFIFKRKIKKPKELLSKWKIVLFEEILFFAGIAFWAYIRAHEPSINGLEKFMDFGFVNSILRSAFFPPADMWFPPFPINYYYFGHLVTAVVTKISFLPSYITYNLMLATLFSFTLALGFSLGLNFISRTGITKKGVVGGLLTGLLLALGGNLHTIYALFKSYNVDAPVPFWQLPLLLNSIPNSYWYPNATRFIPFTIHEFPLYSFVVSDLHGHVLDIPFVLLTIAVIFSLFLKPAQDRALIVLFAFLLAIMYMTNAWDGAIYLLLFLIILLVKKAHILKLVKTPGRSFFAAFDFEIASIKSFLIESFKPFAIIIVLFFILTLPFNFFFKPFASGIGILCLPQLITNIGKLGPFLLEANHCQKTPFWQLLILYGSFYFFVVSFILFLVKLKNKIKIGREDVFILALIVISTILIIAPEIIYVKDIYPAHYRANTMFKLVYQAFMMLTLVAGYSLVRIMSRTKNILFYLTSTLVLIPVFVYPYFATKSYYQELKNYTGLDGIDYLRLRYPEDYKAINWINKNIQGQGVIAEAQGDSYTDYGRISANTGLPTILGWTVHEWLWRGSYDIPSPRIEEARLIYESEDLEETKKLLLKHNVKYIYVGTLEHEKYPNLQESKFEKLGKVIFETGQTKIYKLN